MPNAIQATWAVDPSGIQKLKPVKNRKIAISYANMLAIVADLQHKGNTYREGSKQ